MQSQRLLARFLQPWLEVPTIWIDVETTGTRPGFDRCVQIGFVRLAAGELVGSFGSLINPGVPIPAEATAIHGITDEQVAGAPTIEEVFARPEVQALLEDAQPGAYNGPFDRHFVPPFGEDWTWPWVDALSLVRKHDRFARGTGRHKLLAACEKHGIPLPSAHDAVSDAFAAGQLFYKLGRRFFPKGYTMGDVLGWQRRVEAHYWYQFNRWLSSRPPREEKTDG